MDTAQPTPPVRQPIVSNPSPPQQTTTPWIVLSLLLIATFLTGLAYIFMPQLTGKKDQIRQSFFNNKQQETISSSPTPGYNPPKQKLYNNTKYKYSFDYPDTWEIVKRDVDQKNIELHYVASPDLAIITIEYLSPEEWAKMPPTYCESGIDKEERCYRYQIPDQIDALIDSDNREKTSKDEAVISHPNGGTLWIRTTDTNAESKATFWGILFTLKFLNEK